MLFIPEVQVWTKSYLLGDVCVCVCVWVRGDRTDPILHILFYKTKSTYSLTFRIL